MKTNNVIPPEMKDERTADKRKREEKRNLLSFTTATPLHIYFGQPSRQYSYHCQSRTNSPYL